MKKYTNEKKKGTFLNVVIVTFLMVCMIALPTLGASKSWSMTLSYSVCDGSSNKIYYTGKKGDTINVSGTVYVDSFDKGHYDSSIKTYCYLYRKKIIGYDKICYEKLDTFYDVGDECSINMSASITKNSSKYFLYFYKDGDDGFNLKGSGTISFD